MPDDTKSPKPPSAEEFKLMLREGLANVARNKQLDQMMCQIKNNSSALSSLERKVDNSNDAHKRRFQSIEERLDRGTNPPREHDHRRAAYD